MLTTIKAGAEDRKSAKAPHELFTINMVIVHLFFSLGMIKLLGFSMGGAIASSIALSLYIIVYTFFQTKITKNSGTTPSKLKIESNMLAPSILAGASVLIKNDNEVTIK